MRFEKRFPSLTLTLSYEDRSVSVVRTPSRCFFFFPLCFSSLTLTLTLTANPSWMYSKERVTNDPLRKFSRFLLPGILFFRIVDWHGEKGKRFSRFRVSRIRGEWEKGDRHHTLSFETSLVATSSSFLRFPRATPRIYRGNKCWKHPGGRVSTPWTEAREVLLISSTSERVLDDAATRRVLTNATGEPRWSENKGVDSTY